MELLATSQFYFLVFRVEMNQEPIFHSNKNKEGRAVTYYVHFLLRALVLTSYVYLLLILVTGLQRGIFFLILLPVVLCAIFLLTPVRNSFPAKARPASRSVLHFRPTASLLISLPASRSR
jgi:hypothetical protein